MNDKDLLSQSIGWAVEREPVITRRFYEILFERYPQVRPLFGRNASDAQARMLQDAIVAALDHIEDGPWLTDTLGAIGAKHVSYGVTDEMYGWVGESLIASLAELCGDRWTDGHGAAWGRVYGSLTDLALAGAVRARAEANLPH
ncbi:MAG: globin domain-containing protein [Pseudomonadota bacterium]|nr:globin domain-containing protein [Pseudomonadota bacterium]